MESERAEKKKLEEEFSLLKKESHNLSVKSNLLQETVDDLTSENGHIKEEAAKGKENIELLTEKDSDNEREKSALQEERDKLKTEKDSLLEQIQGLMAEKKELSPYLYLIEAKKEQEALEAAVIEAKKTLQKALDSSTYILAFIIHEEVREALEKAIKSSQELINSADCTFEELNNSKENIDSAIKKAEEQEKK